MSRVITFITVLLAFTFFTTNDIYAQSSEPTGLSLNAGLGYSGYSTGFSRVGISLGGGFAIGAGGEYEIADTNAGVIGIGGDIGYQFGNEWFSVFTIGGKGIFHFNDLLAEHANFEMEELDLYASAGLFLRRTSYSDEFFGGFVPETDNDILPSFKIGARYYPVDNLGAFGEIGYSWAIVNFGVVFTI